MPGLRAPEAGSADGLLTFRHIAYNLFGPPAVGHLGTAFSKPLTEGNSMTRPRSSAALAAGALALGLAAALAAPAPATAAPVPRPVGPARPSGSATAPASTASVAVGEPTTVITANPSDTQKCLDVTGQSTASGTLVEQWTCNGGTNQQWYWTEAGELVGVASGKCLDIPRFSTDGGVQAVIWPCNGGTNQKWTQTLVHHAGVYHLTNVNSGLNLDVQGASPADGTPVVQWPQTFGLNQWWFYGSVSTARG